MTLATQKISTPQTLIPQTPPEGGGPKKISPEIKSTPSASSSYAAQDPKRTNLKLLETKKTGWERAGDFTKGFIWDGPKEMVRGVMELISLPTLIKESANEWRHPGYHNELLKTPEGRKELLIQNLRMMPGERVLEVAGTIALHPIRTVEGIKDHYVQAWKTDEGKGKIGFDVVTALYPLTKSSQIARFAKVGTFGKIPLGAKNISILKNFGTTLMDALKKMGIDDAKLYIRGSSVTGISWRTGDLFDLGRVSDWDIAIESPKLLQRAKELKIKLRSGQTRTPSMDLKFPYNKNLLTKMDLLPIAEKLSQQMGREVGFMIYQSEEAIAKRGEYLLLPHRR